MAVYINIDTGEYPIYPHQIRQANPDVSFPKEIPSDVAEEFGYSVVVQTTEPTGDVVTEGAPEEIEGVWTQTWVSRSYTSEELANTINQDREALLREGIPYTFPGGQPDHIQVTDRDMIVLTNIRLAAAANIDTVGYTQVFRSKSNVNYNLSAQDVIDMTGHVLAAIEQIYIDSWAVKD